MWCEGVERGKRRKGRGVYQDGHQEVCRSRHRDVGFCRGGSGGWRVGLGGRFFGISVWGERV